MDGAVVNVRVPVEPAGVTVKPTNVWLLSLGGPALMALAKLGTVCAAASSSTAGGLFASVNVGASLTKLTVIVKDWVLLLTLGATPEPLSVSVASNVAVPLLSGAGWYVRVPVDTSMAGGVVNVKVPAVWTGVTPT